MLRLFHALGDRILSAFVPEITAQAACTTWKEFCYCSGSYSVYRWCDRGCDSTGTTCGGCTVKVYDGRC
ncbi:hypothetical protein AB0L05_15840 [Nonomuraea pusilla]|uniref:hypothetical protein n=1 Tax=Nonomuraea pusilla TaxID=46177 RepID=UPI0033317293